MDYKPDWEISNKGPNKEYDKNRHQKNKQYLQQGIIFQILGRQVGKQVGRWMNGRMQGHVYAYVRASVDILSAYYIYVCVFIELKTRLGFAKSHSCSFHRNMQFSLTVMQVAALCVKTVKSEQRRKLFHLFDRER